MSAQARAPLPASLEYSALFEKFNLTQKPSLGRRSRLKKYNEREAVVVLFKVRKDGMDGRGRNRYRKSWILKNVMFTVINSSGPGAHRQTQQHQRAVLSLPTLNSRPLGALNRRTGRVRA
jgi:hypothetical protein